MRTVICTGALLVALTAGGCGQSAQDKQEAAAKAAAHRRAVQQAKHERAQQMAYETCTATVGDFQSALGELDSRLSIGMTYDKYSDRVADARVEYDQIDFGALGEDPLCLAGIGIPLEKALNQYAKAAGEWNDCLTDIYCDTDSIDPGLQARWSKASRAIDKAKVALRDMQPSGASPSS